MEPDEIDDGNCKAEESNNGKRVPRTRKTHKQRIVSTGNRRAQRKRQRQAKAKGRR